MADAPPAPAEAAASASSVERLPDGRPMAKRREKRARAPQQQSPAVPPTAGVTTSAADRVAAARLEWLAWHAQAEGQWRREANERVGAGIAMLRLPKPLFDEIEKFMPVIFRVQDIPNAEAAAKLYGKYVRKSKKKGDHAEEFAVAPIYAPPLVHHMAPMGIFPMTIPIDLKLPRFPAFKLHVARAATFVGEETSELRALASPLSNPLRPVDGVSRLAKKYAVVVDSHWDDVCDMVQQQHGRDWLSEELRACFTHMFLNPDRYPNMRLHSIAIVELDHSGAPDLHREIPTPESFSFRQQQGKLPPTIRISAGKQPSGPYGRVVAGELGYACGSMYTSLTGAFVADGTGTLQLAALQALLHLSGFVVWDLGMTMAYKERSLGVEDVPRKQWLRLAGAMAARQPVAPLGTSSAEESGFLGEVPATARPDSMVPPAPLARFAAAPVVCSSVIDTFRAQVKAGPGSARTGA